MNAPVDRAISRSAALAGKYTVERGRVFRTGRQALIGLMVLQRERDARAGVNAAGFVSGYRGSPLGGLDQSLWRAKQHLESHHVRFQPGVNEDLAATSVWGTQQLNLFPKARYDGVFSMWYGKGPGVDRCGDVFKHANFAGTSKHGGVLVLAGDDHAAKSSTLPHQSDHQFSAAMIPVLYPSSVQEILDLGLHGWAMSRYSGCWVGFKCVADTVESSSSVYIDPARAQIIIPDDFPLPEGGGSVRGPAGLRPGWVGKFDKKGEWVRPQGDWLLPAAAELTPAMIARVIARRIERLNLHPPMMAKIRARVDWINAKEAALDKPKINLVRQPYFCSGCPHNTSTKLPDGSRATAGIGCHVMAIWMDRSTSEFTHMGGEGVPWIGQAPFTEEKHIFANLGDGTYYHSGILAIRAAVAADVNITYKILYNDAVAMTGGQPIDGPLTPADVARQVAAEGVKRIIVVSDEPDTYPHE